MKGDSWHLGGFPVRDLRVLQLDESGVGYIPMRVRDIPGVRHFNSFPTIHWTGASKRVMPGSSEDWSSDSDPTERDSTEYDSTEYDSSEYDSNEPVHDLEKGYFEEYELASNDPDESSDPKKGEKSGQPHEADNSDPEEGDEDDRSSPMGFGMTDHGPEMYKVTEWFDRRGKL
ncbi:unnamed protein product [Zymoseptoria tritici ST99CH_1A5]|uniref:Uncharacterized protein n=1 Tax=Zymoseptoria tritici ST99CH_1A5 TaxID=1276529 RepID=A0A1Y6M5C3_ZYMTR|nr:unnamed protein product [Zymoseptoria tritici ST99CH_1A5]